MNPIRIGRFTSSEIYNLMANGRAKDSVGAPFFNYVKKKRQERKMGCSFCSTDSGKAAKWGSFVEWWLMYKKPDLLGLEYTLTPSTTTAHKDYTDYWAGSRDGYNNLTQAVIDLKCPWTRESFADFADCQTIDDVRQNHKDGEKYYWQLVSNVCIAESAMGHKVENAELIIFMPTEEQLGLIQHAAVHGDHGQDVFFIGNANEGDLPFNPSTSQYPSLIKFCFTIPQSDKDVLTERVKKAIELL